ncbi:MAG: TetR/AcrR family transcriptional regulator C-terminal domain-containing protein [Schwartzia sp.]|nr:TetR/AcrR family transcriptional regulator C-terminal domain-containing protein [Schwartzia sp. (in: firmicutes)]
MRKKTTKEMIAHALVELSATKSINKITIQEIAEACGLTKTTFYNHFRDKYDLIVWAYAEPVRDIVSRVDGAGYGIGDAILDIIRYFDRNREFILNALKNTSGQNYFLHHVARIHFTVLRDFVAARSGGAMPEKLEILMKLYAYGTVQKTCEWLLDGAPVPAEQFAAFLEAGIPEDVKPYVYGGKVDDSAKL